MPHVHNGRFTADLSSLGDEVIVFLIGMRINKPWKVHAWWPVLFAMPKMLEHLAQHPDKGLLGLPAGVLPVADARPVLAVVRSPRGGCSTKAVPPAR